MSSKSDSSLFVNGWFAIPISKSDYLITSLIVSLVVIVLLLVQLLAGGLFSCTPVTFKNYHCYTQDGYTYQQTHYNLNNGETVFQLHSVYGNFVTVCDQSFSPPSITLGQATQCGYSHDRKMTLNSPSMLSILRVTRLCTATVIVITTLWLAYYLLVVHELSILFGMLWLIVTLIAEDKLWYSTVALLVVTIPLLVREDFKPPKV
jgi:hypothetical protein